MRNAASSITDIFQNLITGSKRKINDSSKFSELQYETSEKYEWERFSKAIQLILTRPLNKLLDNDIGKLEEYTVKFKKNNG